MSMNSQRTFTLDPALAARVSSALDERPEMLDRYHAIGSGDSVRHHGTAPESAATSSSQM